MTTCTRCGDTKPLDAFGKRQNGRPRQPCKECRRAEHRPRSDEERARAAANARRRRRANPEKARAASRRWYETHAEQARGHARDYYWEHRDRYLEQMRRYKEEHHDALLAKGREADRRDYEQNREQVIAETLHRRAGRQNETLERAVNRGKQWTGPELEIALRKDLTTKEAALMLGRTLRGVEGARRGSRRDPRKDDLAGLPPTGAVPL